jgi:hypothetical protein
VAVALVQQVLMGQVMLEEMVESVFLHLFQELPLFMLAVAVVVDKELVDQAVMAVEVMVVAAMALLGLLELPIQGVVVALVMKIALHIMVEPMAVQA